MTADDLTAVDEIDADRVTAARHLRHAALLALVVPAESVTHVLAEAERVGRLLDTVTAAPTERSRSWTS